MYLSSLVKITIRKSSGRMDFSFAGPDVPNECRSFGRIAGDHDEDDDSEAEVKDKIVEFPIDGFGGEVIDKVEIRQGFVKNARGRFSREGCLTWFKVPTYLFVSPSGSLVCVGKTDDKEIHTNRDRMCEVGSTRVSRNTRIVDKEFSVAPGTAITGFYGIQEHGFRLSQSMLGVITEPAHGL